MRQKKTYVIALIVAAIVVALALANRGGSRLARWAPAVRGH
jgi:hypothetical protein